MTCLAIGDAATLLGVSVPTLRRWERVGKLFAYYRTPGKHRRYRIVHLQLLMGNEHKRAVVGYARVSSHDQKDDLVRQGEHRP